MRLERGRKKRISQINDVVDFYVNENDEQWHEKKHSFREGRRNRERRPKNQAKKKNKILASPVSHTKLGVFN